MANGCVQVFGYILASLGLICLITSTCVNEWKTHEHTDDGMLRAFMVSQGLWMQCTLPSNGRYECDVFGSVLHIPTEVQWTRAIMITSIILSLCGLTVALLGIKCTLCLDEEEPVKGKVAFSGGILIVLAGFCALIIVSWYASGVISNFYDPTPHVLRFSLGKCLFLGWVGALLSITGGAFLACCSLSRSTSHKSYTSPSSAQMTSGKEYV